MHKLWLILLAGVLLVVPIAAATAQERNAPSATIVVDGLSCPFCAYGLEKHLKKIRGMKTVEINMKQGEATVHWQQGVQVDDAALKAAVKKAGFTTREITRH
ncbi:MAG: heavy metal-associated domain-containing protein [Mariprofundales bacterium]